MDQLSRTLAQVRAAKAGDRAALDDLLARYAHWVRQTVALRMGRALRDCGEIDDVVQESLLDAFRGIDRFAEHSDGSFRNWLAQIVLNNVRDHARRRSGRRATAARAVTATRADRALEACRARDGSPSQMAQAIELEARIERALLSLSSTHREVIILRDRCAMSYAEIAGQLGYKNADTARALHHRSLSLLDAALREGGQVAS